MQDSDDLITTGELAKRLGLPFYRIDYAVRVYKLEPFRRVGSVRLWRARDIPEIRSALFRCALRRNGGGQ